MIVQNWNRLPIISDTTRSYSVVHNPFGLPDEIDPNVPTGFFIEENCPVRGLDILPVGPFETEAGALDFLREEFS